MTATDQIVSDERSNTVDITVVIPTKDEEDGIRTCLDAVFDTFAELDISGEVIISDSSSDNTPEIATEMGATVVTPDKGGYGYAYKYAFREASGDIIAIGDGDTTYDFTELPTLVAKHEDGADIVLGSRFAGEIKPGAMPTLHQYVGNPLLTRFLNLFYDTDVTDAHSGFRVFSREVIEELEFSSDGMEFASEMIMQASANDYIIAEVPITYHERSGEATLDSFSDGWRHVRFILKNAPNKLFTIPGVSFTIVGIALMFVSLAEFRPFGQPVGINSMVAGSLLTLVGWQLIALTAFSGYATTPVDTESSLTRWLMNQFSLERGLSLGLFTVLAGGLMLGFQATLWVTSGFTTLPDTGLSIFAATAFVVGLQTIFQSFFASILADAQ